MKKALALIISVSMVSQSFAFAQSNRANDRVVDAMAKTIEERTEMNVSAVVKIDELQDRIADLEAEIDRAEKASDRAKAGIFIRRAGLLTLGVGLVTLYATSRSLRVAAKSGTSDTTLVKLGTQAAFRGGGYISLAGLGMNEAGILLEPAQITKLKKDLKETKRELKQLSSQLTLVID